MLLRELEQKDYIEYLCLLSQLNNMNSTLSKNEFWLKYQLIKNNGGIIYVLENQGVIIGTAKINREIKFYDDIVHIEDVVVDESHRGKGIGKILINKVMNEVPPCYKVVLNCKDELFDFYMNCGFDLQGHSFVIRMK